MASQAQPIRVVIIGAGYTGVWAYKFLRRRIGKLIKRGEVNVTVICPKNYHSFHGFTAEALTGVISIANRQSPLRLVMPGVHHLRAHAEYIDLNAHTVTVRSVTSDQIEKVPYDHLVLANGSYDAMDGVKGMRQHGWSLKEPGGVLSTRNHLIQMIEYAEADPKQAEEALGFVVAGGGFAGVEIAANIGEMLHDMRKLYPILQQGKHRIVLVHSGDALIPQLRPRYNKLADYATREMQKWGVEVKFNTRLTEVKETRAVLSEGSLIPARTVISTIGQRTTLMPGTEQLKRNDGLLIVDEFLRVEDHPEVWTGGDTAQVRHVSGGYCPANALWAIMHGVRLGDNIARTIQGKQLRKFSYRGLGQAASLGVGKAASELYGIPFTGWIGWLLRFFFFIYFLPSRRQAVRMLFDWVLYPFLGRYHTSLESAGENVLAAKRAKETYATQEMPAVVIERL
jgi:NADH dehydrogenase FAD-containing subunit